MASACATYLGIAGASALMPDPMSSTKRLLRIGTYRRMADGKLRYDYSSSGYQWDLGWELLDGTDRATLQTEAERTASMLFSPPTTSASWSVLTTNYQEAPFPSSNGTILWNCMLTLETVED